MADDFSCGVGLLAEAREHDEIEVDDAYCAETDQEPGNESEIDRQIDKAKAF